MASIEIQKVNGSLILAGPTVDKIATEALGATSPDAFIIEVLSSDELSKIPLNQLHQATTTMNTTKIMGLGVGGDDSGVRFVVIIWATGQLFRKALGFPPKHFHILLSGRDDPRLDKGPASLLPGQFPQSPSSDLLDHLAFTVHSFGDYSRAKSYGSDLVSADPESHRGFLRLADASLALDEYKLAMLSFACVLERSNDTRVEEYCLKKLLECAQHTEWGSVMREAELPQIPDQLSVLLLAPWSASLRSRITELEFVPTLQLESRLPLYLPASRKPFKLPRWFRWLVPYHLAIMSTPKNEEDIAMLAGPHLGIRHVLTLTEEEPLPKKWFHGKPITNTFLPIPNFYPPSLEQMDLILSLFDDESKLPLLVHCGGGKGRAGTVAACYLAAYGFRRPSGAHQTQPAMSAPDAIASLRLLRPGSLETSRQEAFVSAWCSAIWKRQSVRIDLPVEPPSSPIEIEGVLELSNIDLLVLVGLPGSGKSWFSQALIARDPKAWRRISQDEAGSRASCESEIGLKGVEAKTLLDRCNAAATDRKGWLQLAANWATAPVCVWFDYDKALCESRAQMRAGHPTLPPGSRVRNAVTQMHDIFVRPTLQEGFKAVIHIKSFSAAEELVGRLSPPVGVCKFPRTTHLINLGAATADDEVLPSYAPSSNTAHVVITEKVDGANMGFWLDPSTKQLRIQNRSHFVNPMSHAQFKPLGKWIADHEAELVQLLNRDPHFASRYILYGEWLAATHSIAYARLPDRFLAFDFYDRSTGRWADRRTLEGLLSLTSIQMVPIIYQGPPVSETELKAMVQLPSRYYDGRVEGVYVKEESLDDAIVLRRGKVVRADFIAGNEHWTKGILRFNELALEG
ncbi:ATP dependent DNA ligase [Mycena indigotica]|uniref:ATP dependent DNA ligase n=1 Tax=Mycena indigotica TaxID=2126181 RepID=A0A8H6SZ83_9AGAR|nr:ATP dependent DNA ligase [Mycena indigotica]KAF7307492.1 ATP dependent DNA ligase [Mycena indigotica]